MGGKQVSAVVFDMDGVLFNTEENYQRLVRDFYAELGVCLTNDELWLLPGRSLQAYLDNFSVWWQRVPRPVEQERTEDPFDRFETWCRGRETPAAKLMNPGVPQTLATLAEADIEVALASSSTQEEIAELIDPVGIRRYFSVVMSGEELAESKPNPEIYLRTLARLGVNARDAVAVEDSDTGIAAARAAGLEVVAKREPRFGFTQEGATWVIDQVPDLLDVIRI